MRPIASVDEVTRPPTLPERATRRRGGIYLADTLVVGLAPGLATTDWRTRLTSEAGPPDSMK
jgi:hypothetical protein